MEQVALSVRVQPKTCRSEILGFKEEVLAVRVKAPPVEGKANRELLELLSKKLGISRGRIEVVRGQTGRNKVVVIAGLSRAEVIYRLSPD
jgi:uncharacterized protein (TIGR00251 family)